MQDILEWMKEFDEVIDTAKNRLYCDIKQRKEGTDITIKQPGMNKENTDIDISAKSMKITCKTDKLTKSVMLTLSDALNTKKTTAECKDGILSIFIPLKKESINSVSIR